MAKKKNQQPIQVLATFNNFQITASSRFAEARITPDTGEMITIVQIYKEDTHGSGTYNTFICDMFFIGGTAPEVWQAQGGQPEGDFPVGEPETGRRYLCKCFSEINASRETDSSPDTA